jgi:folate-binding protein YgfZ
MTLQNDYHVIREGAAIGATSARGQIALTGRDRASYLQGLLTNDIPALQPGQGCYAAWLTAQGRMLTDMHVLQSEGMLLLDVPAALLDETVARLDQFIFSEDVQVAPLAGSLTAVWLHGPASVAVLVATLDGGASPADSLAGWLNYGHASLSWGGAPAVVARIDQVGVPGYCVYLEPAREGAFREALVAHGAVAVSAEALDAARIEAGYAVFGLDMTTETIPLEAGIEGRAISLTKGCYVGQEVIIRVLHRGHGRVAKKLVGLRIEGAAPSAGARILADASAETRAIGSVTSAATSPRLGSVALGYVHRDFTAPGAQVQVEMDGGRAAATVTAFPM